MKQKEKMRMNKVILLIILIFILLSTTGCATLLGKKKTTEICVRSDGVLMWCDEAIKRGYEIQ